MTDVSEAFPPVDYTDLCEVVQRLRLICWTAAMNSMGKTLAVQGWLFHDNLDSFLPFIEALNAQVREFEDGKAKEVARRLITETEKIYAALQIGGIRTPPMDEVLKRYIAGDIGENTAKIVLDLDSYELIQALQEHGLPIMQDVDPNETFDLSFLKKTN